MKDGDGRDTVIPMVMSFNGSGIAPWVFSVLKSIEYFFTDHLGYRIAASSDWKHELMISAVMSNCPGLISVPVPSGEVFQTVAS